MSNYTIKRCLDRAEACRGDGDLPRILREHEEAARTSDPEVGRIATGFAIITAKRIKDERWRAEAYARLARGEELEDPDDHIFTLETVLRGIQHHGLTPALRNEIDILLGAPGGESPRAPSTPKGKASR